MGLFVCWLPLPSQPWRSCHCPRGAPRKTDWPLDQILGGRQAFQRQEWGLDKLDLTAWIVGPRNLQVRTGDAERL